MIGSRRMLRGSGFTLVELLVVVAIIALLISILLPSLSKARQMARTVACSSNLHQFGAAQHLYADQYDDYFAPIWGGWQITWNSNPGFRKMLALEHDSFEAKGYYCPSAPDYVYEDNQWGANYGANNVGQVFGVRSSFGGSHNVISLHRTSVVSPPMKIQMVDAVNPSAPAVWNAVNPEIRWQTYGDRAPYKGGNYHAAYRHNAASGLNALRCDGHVGYLSTEDAYHDDEQRREMMWLLKSGPQD